MKIPPPGSEGSQRKATDRIPRGGIYPDSPERRLYRWLRRRRGAPRPNPTREWSEHTALRAVERRLVWLERLRYALENPGACYEHR